MRLEWKKYESCNERKGNGGRWSGIKWSEMEWSGVEWSGVEWSGVEWRGVAWSGVERGCNRVKKGLVEIIFRRGRHLDHIIVLNQSCFTSLTLLHPILLCATPICILCSLHDYTMVCNTCLRTTLKCEVRQFHQYGFTGML